MNHNTPVSPIPWTRLWLQVGQGPYDFVTLLLVPLADGARPRGAALRRRQKIRKITSTLRLRRCARGGAHPAIDTDVSRGHFLLARGDMPERLSGR